MSTVATGSATRVQFLHCDTTSQANSSILAQSIRSLVDAGGSTVLVRNLCKDPHGGWYPNTFKRDRHGTLYWQGLTTKLRALEAYSRQTFQHDFLVFTDSDVVLNRPLPTPREALQRFRGVTNRSRDVVFMAEPWCYAPTVGSGRHGGRCTTEMLSLYNARGADTLDWRCPRFLNSGSLAGMARDVHRVVLGMLNVTSWDHNTVHGISGSPCVGGYYSNDQCLATSYMLANDDVVLDLHEQLFATASTATKAQEGTTCVPCGNVSCNCSTQFEWEVGKDDGLVRKPEYRARCQFAGGGGAQRPMMIHFNGVGTRNSLLRRPDFGSWLRAGYR